jgi:heme A synthase
MVGLGEFTIALFAAARQTHAAGRAGGEEGMNRLDVKTSKLQLILAALLGLLFVPLGLASLAGGLSGGFKVVPFALGLLMLCAFAAVMWLAHRGHAKSVRYFSDDGLVRNDGRSFAWADLSRVVNQVRTTSLAHGTKAVWRTEIQFRNGESAWLIPTKVGNYPEVSEFVRRLPCEHAEVKVGSAM